MISVRSALPRRCSGPAGGTSSPWELSHSFCSSLPKQRGSDQDALTMQQPGRSLPKQCSPNALSPLSGIASVAVTQTDNLGMKQHTYSTFQ